MDWKHLTSLASAVYLLPLGGGLLLGTNAHKLVPKKPQ